MQPINNELGTVQAQLVLIQAQLVLIKAQLVLIQAIPVLIQAQLVLIQAQLVLIQAQLVLIQAELVLIAFYSHCYEVIHNELHLASQILPLGYLQLYRIACIAHRNITCTVFYTQ